jgi:hypothetical protein
MRLTLVLLFRLSFSVLLSESGGDVSTSDCSSWDEMSDVSSVGYLADIGSPTTPHSSQSDSFWEDPEPTASPKKPLPFQRARTF